MTHRLNELWMSREPIVFRARAATGTIEANGIPFTRVLPDDLRGRSQPEVVREWVTRLAAVFQDRGRAVSIQQ
ncbi:hypothetical protein D3C83_132730 [compost metagenome]